MSSTVVFPGSFDPFTLGHLDIVTRAQRIFGHVTVVVATNSSKEPLLSQAERVTVAQAATAHLSGVTVTAISGLLAEYCREIGASAIVKGLRGGADYDYERPMALMNRSISGVETVFVTGDNSLSHIASSLVRDVWRHGGDVSPYLPPESLVALERVARS